MPCPSSTKSIRSGLRHQIKVTPPLAALYAKGGSVLPQGVAEPVIGEANIRKHFDGMVAGPTPENFKITISEATMLDPKIILANGTYALDFPGQHGGAITHVTGTVPRDRCSRWIDLEDTVQYLEPDATAECSATR